MLDSDGSPTQGGAFLLSMWGILSSEESSSRYRAFKKAEKERERLPKRETARASSRAKEGSTQEAQKKIGGD